jgi:hypothetical protein
MNRGDPVPAGRSRSHGNSRQSTLAIAAAAALVAPSLTAAQQPAFHPGLGDLMTAFVRPRHTKLGLAGNENKLALCRL